MLQSESGEEWVLSFPQSPAHYQIVKIHQFVNGNGRHTRFCADRLVENLGGRPFPCGRDDLRGEGVARQSYLATLKTADAGDGEPLVQFARSGAEWDIGHIRH